MGASRIFLSITLALCLGGCSCRKPEVELAPDNISKVDSSKLTKVYILSRGGRSELNRGVALYHYELPIKPIKGRSILRWIMDAKQTEFDRERLHQKLRDKHITPILICFETEQAVYHTHIGWDDKCVYGYWWESPDLFRVFRGWGFFEDLAQADPNWPAPIWYKNPPPGSDPNFHRFPRMKINSNK